MELDAYLRRIGENRPLDISLEALNRVHRAHLEHIPYENLDIHLGRPLSLDIEQIYDKIVTHERGGWCYEMNGLLAWALRELGFDVTLLASDVTREFSGDGAGGEHLILMVKLDRPYLVDVGFGNGLLLPIPLEVGAYTQNGLTYHLLREGDRWFFQNHGYGGPGFVFTLQPREVTHFTSMCRYLQTSPESGFVRTTVCHIFVPEGTVTLRGAVLRTVTAAGATDQIVDNLAGYEQVLNNTFRLHLPHDEVARLWEAVWERHQVWVQENQ